MAKIKLTSTAMAAIAVAVIKLPDIAVTKIGGLGDGSHSGGLLKNT